jgi:uncharacterized protein YciW
MLDYSAKLTQEPQAIDREDIERLRSVGFDDLGIHDIVCCVSYFAFVNQPDQAVQAALQHPAEGRQELSVGQDHDEITVASDIGHAQDR